MKLTSTLTSVMLAVCAFCSCTPNSNVAREDEPTPSRDTAVVHERTSNTEVVAPDSLLVPGHSVGSIPLENDAAVVMKKFGKPDAGDAAMGKAVSTWFEGHNAKAHALSIFTAKDLGNSDTALIKQIRVTAAGFKTQEGLGTSASLSQLEKSFNLQKQKGYRTSDQDVEVYADPSGIAFEIDSTGKCIGVVVYPSGALHPDTYARFITVPNTQ